MKESYISLKELMKLEAFKRSRILTNEDNMDIPISRINIMSNLKILDNIAKDEILLVEPEIFENIFENYQKNLIQIMKEKGVNAIVLKENIDSISDELIRYANNINFNIIELDKKVCFFELIEDFLDKLFGENELFQKSLEEIHLDMRNILLSGGSINSLLAYLKSKFKYIIVLKNNFYNSIVNNKVKTKVFDFIKTYEDKSNNVDIKHYIVGDVNVYIIPIIANNTIYGNLFITDEINKINKRELVILESVSSLFGIEILKKSFLDKYDNSYKIEFFDNIVSESVLDRRKSIEQAKIYGFREKQHYFCMRVDIVAASHRLDINKVIIKLEEEMLKQNYIGVFAGVNNSVNIIIGGYEKYKKTVYFIENILKNMGYQYFIGVGKEVFGYDKLYKSNNTLSTVFSARKIFDDRNILFYDELGYYKFLGHSLLKEDLLKYSIDVLKDLIEYDSKKDGELLKTLRVYFQSNCNIKKTGDALFTHYNTALYRISRIEKILNVDFSNEDDRLEVITAIKIMDLYNFQKTC